MTQPLPRIEPYELLSALLSALGGNKRPPACRLSSTTTVLTTSTSDSIRWTRSRRCSRTCRAWPHWGPPHSASLPEKAAPGSVASSRLERGLPRTPRLALLRDRSPCTRRDMAASGSAMRLSSRKVSRSDDHRPCMRARAGRGDRARTASRSAGTPSSWDRERSGCPDRPPPVRESPLAQDALALQAQAATELDPDYYVAVRDAEQHLLGRLEGRDVLCPRGFRLRRGRWRRARPRAAASPGRGRRSA